MEDVLDLYAEPVIDPQRPVVCFDETVKPTQLLAETRPALPAAAGTPQAAGL